MLLSAAAHAGLGFPSLRPALQSAGVPGDVTGALAIGWYWGSAAMAAFGVITLVSGRKLWRGDVSLVPALLAVAGCYLIFGAVAFVQDDFNPHFLLFMATGLQAGLPVLIRRSAPGLPSPSR
jgi:hypothetical protein